MIVANGAASDPAAMSVPSGATKYVAAKTRGKSAASTTRAKSDIRRAIMVGVGAG
jgi:hypothetical protein